MSLRQVETESLGKSFLLFFISLSILVTLIQYKSYKEEIKTVDEKIWTQMKLCSFDLKCTNFTFDFVQSQEHELYTLQKSDEGIFAFFTLPNNTDFFMKLLYPQTAYQEELSLVKKEYLYTYLIMLFGLIFVSGFFSWYALKPLRQALRLSDEFIKDILHDFNTPLSSLRINSSLLKKEFPQNTKISRIENAVQTILNLQDNLRSYIDESVLENEIVNIEELIKKRCLIFSQNYPNLSFEQETSPMSVHTNLDALTRILDNLLSNAAKYNKKEGSIKVILNADEKKLVIEDTGKGIRHPDKIFQRFYKEHERGLGIGLHIVKKLCDALDITIGVRSERGVGSTFSLDLKNLH